MANPTVLLVNYSSTPLPFTLEQLAVPMQMYVDRYITPPWSKGCKIEVYPDPFPQKTTLAAAAGDRWLLFFFDTTDQAGALGYHAESPLGIVEGFVFVKTNLDNGESVSATASHELVEMLVDPACNSCRELGNGLFVIEEPGDPVERSSFGVAGMEMSNFVLPGWFDAQPPPGTKFDALGHLTGGYPQLEAGGYISMWKKKGGWTQIYGAKTAPEKKQVQMRLKRLKDHSYSRLYRRAAKREIKLPRVTGPEVIGPPAGGA